MVATLLMAVAVCLLAIPAISANAVTTTIIAEEENGNDTDLLLIEDIKAMLTT